MRAKYLGDTYDLVKRVWRQTLDPVGPLYAHPLFIPADIRAQYTALTSIQVLDLLNLPKGRYGLFFDPDTGIPLPHKSVPPATASHASLSFIVSESALLRPTYMVCYDQSYHRRPELTRMKQRARKRAFLDKLGIRSFYYVSHAPFLFMAKKQATLAAVRDRLLALGIPQKCLEPQDQSGEPQ